MRLLGKLNGIIHVKFSVEWLVYIRHDIGEIFYYY